MCIRDSLMRNEQRFYLMQSILQGKVLGKRGIGRPRISWLRNLRNWFDMNTTDLFRTAVQKVKIACMIYRTSETDKNHQKKKNYPSVYIIYCTHRYYLCFPSFISNIYCLRAGIYTSLLTTK